MARIESAPTSCRAAIARPVLALKDTKAPPVVTYNCPADSGPLTAQFYTQFDPQTAVLNWKGSDVILVQPSGSGARYGRQDYWEHRGQGSPDLSGTKFVCTT